MTCTSGGPRTHAVLNRPPISVNKASSQALVYNQTLVCEDAVNAEVLLRLARNELLERAQQADRRVTALVDEEFVLLFLFSFILKNEKTDMKDKLLTRWRYTIRQCKNGDYNVQASGLTPCLKWNVRLIIGVYSISIRCSTRLVPRSARAKIRARLSTLGNPLPSVMSTMFLALCASSTVNDSL